MIYQWGNNSPPIMLAVYSDGRVRVVDNPDEFAVAVSSSPMPVNGSTPARLQCSPAQMRLTLYRAGLLPTVQAIADSDPEASIVWEYATVIVRESPLIAALGAGHFTAAEIDDLFYAAMALTI